MSELVCIWRCRAAKLSPCPVADGNLKEDSRLRELLQAGLTPEQIALRLNRPQRTDIYSRVQRWLVSGMAPMGFLEFWKILRSLRERGTVGGKVKA
jgi:hypothetical protein